MSNSLGIEIDNLNVILNNKTIVSDVNIKLNPNNFFTIVGPNGAGKSTLIKAIAKDIDYSGDIKIVQFVKDCFESYDCQADKSKIDGNNSIRTNVQNLKPQEYAKYIGFMSQSNSVAYDFRVYDVVSLGRYVYTSGPIGRLSDEDKSIIGEAIDLVGLTNRANQSVQTLSGGELQRVFIAQLFCQRPKIMILDEPTNNLDLKYQKQIFGLFQEWQKLTKNLLVCVVHDLSLAKMYSDKVILMKNGQIFSTGPTSQVLTESNLKSVYEFDVHKYLKQLNSCWI